MWPLRVPGGAGAWRRWPRAPRFSCSMRCPITVSRERRLPQPHAQSGGTVHHLGPSEPRGRWRGRPEPLSSPRHITHDSLPPQISSIIQGQLDLAAAGKVQQQQVLQGPSLTRPLLLGLGSGPGTSAFGMTPPPPPTSPSRTAVPPASPAFPHLRGAQGVVEGPSWRRSPSLPGAGSDEEAVPGLSLQGDGGALKEASRST